MSAFEHLPSCQKQWTVKDRECLEQIREVLAKELSEQPPFPEVVGDRRLLRFVRGKQYDVKTAIEMIRKHLKWRKDNNVNEIRQNIVVGGRNTPFYFPKGREILEIQKQIVASEINVDKLGRPLCLEDYDFDPNAIFTEGRRMEDYETWLIYTLEYRCIVMVSILHILYI